MAELRYGIVTFKGKAAGTLSETAEGGTLFKYNQNAPEIACALPRGQEEHEWKSGVHPVFAHLAPEGWLRERQEALADASDEDDFGLLLAFGADCIGAIGIEDPEDHGVKFRITAEADKETQALAESHRTISGVQAKILCQKEEGRFIPARADGPAPYIAKFARESLSDLVGNEALSLELAGLLLPKDEVNIFQRVVVSGIEKPGLIVTRFDRVGSDYTEKLRCEDFAQIIAQSPGKGRGNKYLADYADLAKALSYSANSKIDAYTVFQRIIAFLLLGNTDCHLKNWSLLETSRGLRLSPVYDVVNGYIYGSKGYTTTFGLRIDGRGVQWEDYDRDVLYEVARRLEINKRAADLAFRDIEKRKEYLFRRLNEALPLGEEAGYQYKTSVSRKWEELYD